MRRRHFLLSPLLFAGRNARADVAYPQVEHGVPLRFPRDHGSHPAFRTEWWYVTGILGPPEAQLGVQITFFRSRPGVAESGKSRFTPRELLFAHAAIALPDRGRLLSDQRAAREGFGLAEASERTTDVHIDDWTLALREDVYIARIAARDFMLALEFRMTRPRRYRCRVARSRMVEHLSRARSAWLGLGRHQFRRRRRIDGVSYSR